MFCKIVYVCNSGAYQVVHLKAKPMRCKSKPRARSLCDLISL